MTSGMSIRGLANRVRHLERRLRLRASDLKIADESGWPVMEYDMLCAVLGVPQASNYDSPPTPRRFLKEPRLVRWLRRFCPERLEELKQAHARGEPSPEWIVRTDDTEE